MKKDFHVLLVDDDPTYLEIMAEHLEEDWAETAESVAENEG